MYRAAGALDPHGNARDLADSLYADLFGLKERDGERQSLFRYFHGRSSLTTWLRAVLAQRHVDRHRAAKKIEPLPEDESTAVSAPAASPDLERPRYVRLMTLAMTRAIAALAARERLRLACYYAQELTLAQIGRLLSESEATASRQLAKTRRAIRADIERQLMHEHGLGELEVRQCFESVADDAGSLDLGTLLGGDEVAVARSAMPNRSSREGAS
jgi:RNA polymerase sigma-70 factor (ECF subfamily)